MSVILAQVLTSWNHLNFIVMTVQYHATQIHVQIAMPGALPVLIQDHNVYLVRTDII